MPESNKVIPQGAFPRGSPESRERERERERARERMRERKKEKLRCVGLLHQAALDSSSGSIISRLGDPEQVT